MGWLDRIRSFLLPPSSSPARPADGGGGWYPIVREPYTGAWQQDVSVSTDSVLANPTVYTCTRRIAEDIGKTHLGLVEQDESGIWIETSSPAFSPVLRKPNAYQTIHKFLEQWIVSKLVHGNTYILKQRDARRLVVGMHVLHPTRVEPLVTPAGDVYYSLQSDRLAGLEGLVLEGGRVVVPAREIIHDPCICLFHPLIGVSPIFACGLAAIQGSQIQANSSQFFGNRSQPAGILTAPGAISDETAARLKAYFESEFTGAKAGRTAVVGDGLKYEPLSFNAVDAQLIEQLKWTAETICSCYFIPPSMIGVGPPPPYANSEPLVQQYYAQCLQSLMTAIEASLEEGLELPTPYGTAFDIDDLIWMDTATKTKAAADAIGSGAMTPNEARAKYFGLGPVPGGDSPYLQQQYYSLAALAARDTAASAPAPPPPAALEAAPPDEAATELAYVAALDRKALSFHDEPSAA